MTQTANDIYLAFKSGAIAYDCAPCGRCCRGLGIGVDLVQLSSSEPVQRLAAFIDGDNSSGPMRSFFTYADGCRYLGDDNLCDLHRDSGPAAKPRICRLFPFSKLVDVNGLWTVLPHHSCPWTASVTPHPYSNHADILSELQSDDGALPGQLKPASIEPRTPMPPLRRRVMEEAIRDALVVDGELGAQLDTMAALQAEHHEDPVAAPSDKEIWLDMLRTRGDPAPLPEETRHLFAAALPAMRILLLEDTELITLPNMLRAFELWLRTLRELRPPHLTGEDLLALLRHASPMLRVLACAEMTIPVLPPAAPAPELADIWIELMDKSGSPLGETLLAVMRQNERGALATLMHLGQFW